MHVLAYEQSAKTKNPWRVALETPSHLRRRALGAWELKTETHEAWPCWEWWRDPLCAVHAV